MSRTDQTLVTVIIDYPGLGNLGIFEDRTGGKGESESVKHREGGMGPELSYGGPQSTDNVTVARRFDPIRDGNIAHALMAARGRANMHVVEMLLDTYGNPWNVGPMSWNGKLKSVELGDANANSTAIRMLTLEQDTEQFS